MSLVEFLMFFLGTTGFTIIIVASYLFEPIREYLSSKSSYVEKLINCTMCSGFWVVLIASLFYDVNHLWAATITSLSSWSIHSFVSAAISIESYFDEVYENEDE